MSKLRFVSLVAAVVFASGAAFAQPGAEQPPGMSSGTGYVPPPYAYQPKEPTPEEQDLMAHGYITDGQVIGGGLAAIFIGFGVGQGIQGRWHERGWVFTLSESLASAAMLGGAYSVLAGACIGGTSPDECSGNGQGAVDLGIGLVISGAIAFTAFRVWEVADAFAGPASHNDHVRALRRRYGYREPIYTRVTPYISRPQATDGGMTAGLSLRF